MTMSKKKLSALAAGLSCLLAGYALAQQLTPGQTDPAAQPRPGDAQRTAGSASADVDHYIASCWQAKNQAAVEISEIAEQKARNPQVKQFAQTMVQEHKQLSQKLQPLAAGQAATNNQAINELIAIDKQIVDRSTEMAQQKLDEKPGVEFDKCYLGGQVACHMQALAALDVISRQTSGQLKQLASDTKPKIEQHLQEAEQLLKQQEGAQLGGRQQTGAFRDQNLRPAGAERQ